MHQKLCYTLTIWLLCPFLSSYCYSRLQPTNFKQIHVDLEKKIQQSTEPFFVILITSRNNEDVCRENIQSSLLQEYPHDSFHIVYVDDASTDKTVEQLQKAVAYEQGEHLVSLVVNEFQQLKATNFFNAVHECPDKAIIVELDGDDMLAHHGVLKRLKQAYIRPEIWLTFGQFRWKNHARKGYCQPFPQSIIEQGSFRTYKWISSAVRTFYAKLFKKIDPEDLKLSGEFAKMGFDYAMMIPLLEMAGHHHRFIPDILYVYNDSGTDHDCFHDKSGYKHRLKKKVSNGSPYQALEKLF